MTTFCEHLVKTGRGIVKSQIEAWEYYKNEKEAETFRKILALDSEAAFINHATMFLSGRMYDDNWGAFTFDESDPRWTLVDGKHNFPSLTIEEVKEHKRYTIDFFSSGYLPDEWNKDRSDVVWCASIWDKKKKKRQNEWYYGYDLDMVVTVCWRLIGNGS